MNYPRANVFFQFDKPRGFLYTLFGNEGKIVDNKYSDVIEYLDLTQVKNGWMKQVKKLPVILRFLAYDIIDVEKEHSLKEQLDRHVMELNTFKEADLCGSMTIEDRVFVSTIHKAKGLEFDNVIVFDVVDGRIPNYYNGDNQQLNDEDARKLYVAMSRAKRRLFIAYSKAKLTAYGIKQQRLSRFLDSVKEMME